MTLGILVNIGWGYDLLPNDTKAWPEPLLIYLQLHRLSHTILWNSIKNSNIHLKMHFKMSSGKWLPFCPGLDVLKMLIWHGSWDQRYHFAFIHRVSIFPRWLPHPSFPVSSARRWASEAGTTLVLISWQFCFPAARELASCQLYNGSTEIHYRAPFKAQPAFHSTIFIHYVADIGNYSYAVCAMTIFQTSHIIHVYMHEYYFSSNVTCHKKIFLLMYFYIPF